MAGGERQKRDFARYPKYREQYIRCFDAMIENRKRKGLKQYKTIDWATGEETMRWWIGEAKGTDLSDMVSLLEEADE